MDDIKRLIPAAAASKLYAALLVAAFFGNVELIKLLIEAGADVNGQALPEDIGGFHSHASPLHQAVYSGSLEVVRILIGAGSDLHKKDSAFKATPMDWAIYAQAQKDTAEEKAVYEDIENYLLTIYR
jgi:peptide-methionine (S)-S-oxide reductase